jgi:hypothetical protein
VSSPILEKSTPIIHKEQVVRHLGILGYKEGDPVYLRAFLPKEDPRYSQSFAKKSNILDFKEIQSWQEQGYGVYFVVNGGGHTDKDVEFGRAIFCEFDDRPVEQQIHFWQQLGLPEPSLQVVTRKSVHSYWVFESPVPIEKWRDLQLRLLATTGSDQALKNPSRVLRLAGCWHFKPGKEPIQCTIIHEGRKFSFDELDRCLAKIKKPQKEQCLYNRGIPFERDKQTVKNDPAVSPVPLENCLAKGSRLLLANGAPEGSRNTSGAKLARDLIGTANYLNSINQPYKGDPRDMLQQFADRCTPPLEEKEVELIWRSAEKDNPSPSCPPTAINKCLQSWKRKALSNETPKIIQSINSIIHQFDCESLRLNALMELSSKVKRNFREILLLAKVLEKEQEDSLEIATSVENFQKLVHDTKKHLDVKGFLNSKLAVPLEKAAKNMPTRAEYLFNTLLPAAASIIGNTSRIIINPGTGYSQPCIFWTANVAHSGQAKTPPQKLIISPLEKLEAEANERYEAEIAEYNKKKEKQERPPIRKRYIIKNTTISTKIRIIGQSRGATLEYIDELLSDTSRLNQYKGGGKGDDLQQELEFWNGGSCIYDRLDAHIFIEKTAISKTGTYQWDTLAELMRNKTQFIYSGYLSRFLFCSIVDAPPRILDLTKNETQDLNIVLSSLYRELEKLPHKDYLLSPEAKLKFQAWNHLLVDLETSEKDKSLAIYYPKIEAYTARIALWLHLVNAILNGEQPGDFIDGNTMERAIEIANFYLSQYRLLLAHNSPENNLEGTLLKIQCLAERFYNKTKQGINASLVKSRLNFFKNWLTEKIRNLFKILAESGFGKVLGEGAKMQYIPSTVNGANNSNTPKKLVEIGEKLVVPPIAESIDREAIQPLIGEIGDFENQEDSYTEISHDQQVELNPNEDSSHQFHQFTNCQGDTRDKTLVEQGSTTLEDPPISHQFLHQFTNCQGDTRDKTLVEQGSTTLEDPPISHQFLTNCSPNEQAGLSEKLKERKNQLKNRILACSTWVEIVDAIRSDYSKLKCAESMQDVREKIVNLLSEHIIAVPKALSELSSIPQKLLQSALERLRFDIEVFDEGYLSNCKFVKVDFHGTRFERWCFETSKGKRLPIFSLESIISVKLID